MPHNHSPEDYDWVLLQFNQNGVTPLVVAGQAVNIWGKAFREWDDKFSPYSPKIQDFLPLSSSDLEILETGLLEKIEGFEGIKDVDKQLNPFFRVKSPDTATVIFENEKGPLKVQVMSYVLGPDNSEIRRKSVPIKTKGTHATVQVSVPDPLTLMECKVANLRKLDQAVRQDLKHLHILICCVRALIRQSVQAGNNREALNIIQDLRAMQKRRSYQWVAKTYSINWSLCIPLPIIEEKAASVLEWRKFLQHFRPPRGTSA